MTGAVVGIAIVVAVVAVFALFFLMVKRVVGIAVGVVVVLLVVAVIAGLVISVSGGDMPPLLDSLFRLIGNVVREIFRVFADVLRFGVDATSN